MWCVSGGGVDGTGCTLEEGDWWSTLAEDLGKLGKKLQLTQQPGGQSDINTTLAYNECNLRIYDSGPRILVPNRNFLRLPYTFTSAISVRLRFLRQCHGRGVIADWKEIFSKKLNIGGEMAIFHRAGSKSATFEWQAFYLHVVNRDKFRGIRAAMPTFFFFSFFFVESWKYENGLILLLLVVTVSEVLLSSSFN